MARGTDELTASGGGPDGGPDRRFVCRTRCVPGATMIATPMATQAGLRGPAHCESDPIRQGRGGWQHRCGGSLMRCTLDRAPGPAPAGPGSQGGAPRIAAISLTPRTAYAPSRTIALVRRAIRVLSRTAKCWSAKGRGRPFGVFGVVAMRVGSSGRLQVRISHKDQARIAP